MAKKLQSPSGLSAFYINTTYYRVALNLYKHLWQELSINQMKTQRRPPSSSTDQQSLTLKDTLTLRAQLRPLASAKLPEQYLAKS